MATPPLPQPLTGLKGPRDHTWPRNRLLVRAAGDITSVTCGSHFSLLEMVMVTPAPGLQEAGEEAHDLKKAALTLNIPLRLPGYGNHPLENSFVAAKSAHLPSRGIKKINLVCPQRN